MTMSRSGLGGHLRRQREQMRTHDAAYSLRQVAERVGVSATYLSAVERGVGSPPTEAVLERLAGDLDLDRDVVLALAGKVSSDLQAVIRKRPVLFAELLRELKSAPDHAVLRLVREVRDGKW